MAAHRRRDELDGAAGEPEVEDPERVAAAPVEHDPDRLRGVLGDRPHAGHRQVDAHEWHPSPMSRRGAVPDGLRGGGWRSARRSPRPATRALLARGAALVEGASPERVAEFATGRHCAHGSPWRRSWGRRMPVCPSSPTRGGAPVWPSGVVGSITHCTGWTGAVAARARVGGARAGHPPASGSTPSRSARSRRGCSTSSRPRASGRGSRAGWCATRASRGTRLLLQRQGGGLQGVVPADRARRRATTTWRSSCRMTGAFTAHLGGRGALRRWRSAGGGWWGRPSWSPSASSA